MAERNREKVCVCVCVSVNVYAMKGKTIVRLEELERVEGSERKRENRKERGFEWGRGERIEKRE